jgi:hypothetical protein
LGSFFFTLIGKYIILNLFSISANYGSAFSNGSAIAEFSLFFG